jgi:hypothetical protein
MAKSGRHLKTKETGATANGPARGRRARKDDIGAEPAKVKRQSKHRSDYKTATTKPRDPIAKNYWGDT